MTSIEIVNLTKKYGKSTIIDDYNGTINNEKITFIVGHNGSGKTTFGKCLVGHTHFDGLIKQDNFSYSFCPDRINFPEFDRVYSYLKSIYHCYKRPSASANEVIDRYLNLFNIMDYKRYLLSDLSKGTLQKVLLIQTLLKEADVYFFDEPIDGLDTESKKAFISLLKDLVNNGKIVIISTHYLHEYRIRKYDLIKLEGGYDVENTSEIFD